MTDYILIQLYSNTYSRIFITFSLEIYIQLRGKSWIRDLFSLSFTNLKKVHNMHGNCTKYTKICSHKHTHEHTQWAETTRDKLPHEAGPEGHTAPINNRQMVNYNQSNSRRGGKSRVPKGGQEGGGRGKWKGTPTLPSSSSWVSQHTQLRVTVTVPHITGRPSDRKDKRSLWDKILILRTTRSTRQTYQNDLMLPEQHTQINAT